MKTISFGGLGDAYIVWLKLRQLTDNMEEDHHHLFVESNPTTCDLIREFAEKCYNFKFDVECDPNYQSNFFSHKWEGRRPINTAWDGNYHFPGNDNIKLMKKWAFMPNSPLPDQIYKYDVCIQVAAGVNSNRCWKFDPRRLRDLLKSKGYKVSLVGTAEEYKEDEPFNFVGKTSLNQSYGVVALSKIYCGLSGFHTYSSLSQRIRNIHLEESEEHNKHYIHPDWNEFRYGIKIGSMAEVIAGLRHWRLEI